MNTGMKESRSGLGKLLLAAAIGAVALMAMSPAPAKAGQQYYGTINIPTDLIYLSAGTSNSTSGTAFDVPANTDLAIMPTLHGVSATTSNVVYGFNGTPDGTNWTTTAPIQGGVIANGSTSQTGYILVNHTNLTGFKQIRFGYASTTSVAVVTNDTLRVGWFY